MPTSRPARHLASRLLALACAALAALLTGLGGPERRGPALLRRVAPPGRVCDHSPPRGHRRPGRRHPGRPPRPAHFLFRTGAGPGRGPARESGAQGDRPGHALRGERRLLAGAAGRHRPLGRDTTGTSGRSWPGAGWCWEPWSASRRRSAAPCFRCGISTTPCPGPGSSTRGSPTWWPTRTARAALHPHPARRRPAHPGRAAGGPRPGAGPGRAGAAFPGRDLPVRPEAQPLPFVGPPGTFPAHLLLAPALAHARPGAGGPGAGQGGHRGLRDDRLPGHPPHALFPQPSWGSPLRP
jgi:hypothetical protein